VSISEALVGQVSAAEDGALAISAATSSMPQIAERGRFPSGACDIPGLYLAGNRMSEPRPGLPGPKVSFASILRWGTEPEGWYVDLPYAVFLLGVNYSPLECRRFSAPPSSSQPRNQEDLEWIGKMLT
jgi:hypothetical protein